MARRRRNGFTLVETIMVVVVVGLAGIIAIPKFSSALAVGNLKSARTKVMGQYSAARAASLASGRPTFLHVHDDLAYITATPRRTVGGTGTQDTIGSIESIATQYGVSILTTRDSVRIDPNGIGGNDATIRLVKGSRVDTLVISQYGRVLK